MMENVHRDRIPQEKIAVKLQVVHHWPTVYYQRDLERSKGCEVKRRHVLVTHTADLRSNLGFS